ncbi:MAG: STAS domain-containing protein [Planctomycetota bacterium]
MKVTKEIRGETALLTCRGEFDSFVVNPFLEEIEGMISSGVKGIALNLRLVKFINSTAIGCIIKCRKLLKARGGDLVISCPSPFVHEVLENLGLTLVLSVFESDDQALDRLQPATGEPLPKENTIMVQFRDAAKQQQLGKPPCVGKINALDEDGVSFTLPGDPSLFGRGDELKVKFRLPLYRNAYYFNITGRIERAEVTDEGVRVRAAFTDIYAEDRQSIAQFVADLKLLREEARPPQ